MTLDLTSKNSNCFQCGEPDSARISGQSGSYAFGPVPEAVRFLSGLPAREDRQSEKFLPAVSIRSFGRNRPR